MTFVSLSSKNRLLDNFAQTIIALLHQRLASASHMLFKAKRDISNDPTHRTFAEGRKHVIIL